MKNDAAGTSQDEDRKQGKDHIAENPRAAKNLGNHKNSKVDDQRHLAREVHTNHFTNRSPDHNE